MCLTFRIALILLFPLCYPFKNAILNQGLMLFPLVPCAFIYICKRLAGAARQRTGGLCILNMPHPQHQALWSMPPTLQGQNVKSLLGQGPVNICMQRHISFLFLLPSQTSPSEPCVLMMEGRGYFECIVSRGDAALQKWLLPIWSTTTGHFVKRSSTESRLDLSGCQDNDIRKVERSQICK